MKAKGGGANRLIDLPGRGAECRWWNLDSSLRFPSQDSRRSKAADAADVGECGAPRASDGFGLRFTFRFGGRS